MSTTTLPALLLRLIAGISSEGPARLDQHQATHGPRPQLAHSRSGLSHDLIDELERAGLRGRGGAAFPTATKLRAVMWAGGRSMVVANGCEGEPASLKDRPLLERTPHLVLDGALLAAECVHAGEFPRWRPREAAHGAADGLRTRTQRTPHAGPQSRDARADRADRSSRRRLVPRARHR